MAGKKTNETIENNVYNVALRNIYDELYELNITKNHYRIIYHVEGKYVTPPEDGALTDGIADVAAHMIHPEDSRRFLDFLILIKYTRHWLPERPASLESSVSFGRTAPITGPR